MKKVRFHKVSTIFLIPLRSEIENYKDLWWTREDKQLAYQSAISEIRRLLFIHPSMKLNQAKQLLYQRNSIEYCPEYFSDSEGETVSI
jgi:hypothetical protein